MPLSTRLINLRIHRHLDKTPYLQILLFRSSSVHQPNVFTNELQGDSRQTNSGISFHATYFACCFDYGTLLGRRSPLFLYVQCSDFCL